MARDIGLFQSAGRDIGLYQASPGGRRIIYATARRRLYVPPMEELIFPADMPAAHQPALPDLPTGANTPIELSSGNYTLDQDNTQYVLTGNVGTLTVAVDATVIEVVGNGYSVNRIDTPVQFSDDDFRDPRCSHITFRDLTTTGNQGSFAAIYAYGSHLLFQNITVGPGSNAHYCLYSWGADNLTIKDCNFYTTGIEEACQRIVIFYKAAAIGGVRVSEAKHSMRIHGGAAGFNTLCPDGVSRYFWASDIDCVRPWYIGYDDRPDEAIDHTIYRRCTVNTDNDAFDGAVFQYAPPSLNPNSEITDCDFLGATAPGRLGGWQTTADGEAGWVYSGNTAATY